MTETYKDLKIKPVEGSKVEIEGEVSAEIFNKNYQTALKETVRSTEIPGFRTGNAPESMVVSRVGEMKILEKAAGITIDEIYGKIMADNNIRAIGSPSVLITKLAINNPLGFKIQTAVFPEVKIENYKKLADEEISKIPENILIDEKDVDEAIEDIRKKIAKDNGQEGTLPEVNIEFIKKFGDFNDVSSFKNQIRDNLQKDKKMEVTDKRRAAIAEKLIASAEFDIPEIIVQSELDSMIGQFRADVEKTGTKFDSYLNQVNKKEEEIRKEWQDQAVKRARLELILKHIARQENLKPNEEDLNKEINHIMSHHKDADRFRVRMYIENLMTNQKVFEFLESNK